jgi:hypothetical protein
VALGSLGQRKTGIRVVGTPLVLLGGWSQGASRSTRTAAADSSMKGRIRPWTPQEPLLLANVVPATWVMLGGSRRLALS